MESHGLPNRIHPSHDTYRLAAGRYAFTGPHLTEVKGKGVVATYFLRTPDEAGDVRHSGIPRSCVVSNEEKAQIVRNMGAEMVINRSELAPKFWNDEGTKQDPREWKRFGAAIRDLTGGEDIDIVFEHPGRETFGASVFVTRKGGTITTYASTSG